MKKSGLALAIILLLASSVTVHGQNISISNYEFIVPEGWQVMNKEGHVFIQSQASGCQILILEPQASSGDLEADAIAVFDMMYPTANWRYTYQDERKYALARGYLPKGLRFSMMEASMNATTTDGQYHTEDGVALVIQAGDQIVIISIRHSSLLSHWDCKNKYTVWPRFFNSLDVQSVPRPMHSEFEPEKRLIGVWKLASGGVASGEYVFAANGNFKQTGGVGTSTTTSDDYYQYIHIKSYAFEGDGSYSLDGEKLILKRRAESIPEQRQFRLEEVNHSGTGWTDRIYLLSHDSSIGGPSEVCYEKMPK
jgi:hypothetical protein